MYVGLGKRHRAPSPDHLTASGEVRDLHRAQEANLEVDRGEGLALGKRAGVGNAHGAVNEGAEQAAVDGTEQVEMFGCGMDLDDRVSRLDGREAKAEEFRQRGRAYALVHRRA